MVTATTGTATFKGLQSGKIYTPSLYISDVSAAAVLWNQNGAATSSSDSTLQFNEDVQLIDLAIISGPTVITGFTWYAGGTVVPASNQLIATCYTSVVSGRSFNPVGFKASRLISAKQF